MEKNSSDKNTISKRREHAKQLANLAYSDDPTTSIATTATSTSTNDSAYNMNTTIISPTNNNNNSNTSFIDQRPPTFVQPMSSSKRRNENRPRTNSNKSGTSSNSVNDAFGSDPFASFDAFGMSSPEPTSKFSSDDFSELDFFAGQMAGATTPVYQAKESKRQHQPSSSSKTGTSRRNSPPVSLDNFFTEDDSSSFCSTNDLSTIDNNGISAAARRRMRSHMQSKQSDAPSVGSGASLMARSRSSPQMPPGSPGVPKSRYASQKNAKNSGWGNISSDHQQSPFRSTGSVASSTANYSSSSPGVNLFDSDNEAGLTFDAFGLDESQVERDVSSAMKDILGNGGFSIFDGSEASGSNSESGHGSFSGHQTDASENSFEAQKWDSSPNPSRGPSPVPLHYKKGGISPATPQKTPVKLSSVQKRRLQRSVQRGAVTTVSAAMTPQRGNSNNNSNNLRQISSEPPAKTKTASQFGRFSTDPWQEDPFASSDDGGRLSDLFADSGSDSNTARRLYADTQSNVHDYYPSGSMKAATNSLLDATTPKNATPSSAGSKNSNYARSDIGVSGLHRLSFESPMSKSPGFFELPPADENGNQSESDQSDDMDQIQDDLAYEFAKDIVRRISPSGRSQGTNSPSKRSAHSYRSTASKRDENPDRRIQYGDGRIDESESDDQGVKGHYSQHSANRFGSFRARYERSRSSSAILQGKARTASNANSDLGRSGYHGSLRSSYDASKTRPDPSVANEPTAVLNEPISIPKWQHSRETPIEEKKEDNEYARSPNSSPPPKKVDSLKARWESKSRAAPVRKPALRAPPKTTERSEHAKINIDNMDNSFEMLTPDIIEQRRQIAKKDKLNNLRKSMGVVDEPKVPEEKPKLDSGGWNGGSTMLGKVLDHVERESPSNRFQRSNDTKSDIGSSPSYLSNVQLRKVASPESFSPAISPSGTKMTYRERREIEFKAQRVLEEAKEANTPVEKKMNYRERREMELKLQREREDRTKMNSPPQSTPEKDVASLIRKRISANKKRDSPRQNSHQFSSNNSNSIQQQPKLTQKKDTYHHESHVPNFRDGTGIHKNEKARNSGEESPPQNPSKMLENVFASRAPPAIKQPNPEKPTSSAKPSSKMLENLLQAKTKVNQPMQNERSITSTPDVTNKVAVPDVVSQCDAKSMLSGFLLKRSPSAIPLPSKENNADDVETIKSSSKDESNPPVSQPSFKGSGGLPALKDDPKFERYFRMLKMGLPLDVVKHAMVRDGLDPSVLDMDHNKPIGVPLKDDPKFTKYFKMLKIGISIDQVKHSMERDGLDPAVMDQDHNAPAMMVEKKEVKKKKETHRRARLHWKSFGKVMKNSLWDTVQSEVGGISIDEDEFDDLFQSELKASNVLKTPTSNSKKKGAAIRVINSKRANNGGIILARVKLTHDQMADAVDRMDASTLTAGQIENVIEYLPTKEERDELEKYMLEGEQDAAEKFDGLCECEKFMVSMMTVKHAKRKIRALLFKLQFMTCMESITKDAQLIDTACDELINSNRLRQLLGIILQFGNRLNTAGSSSKSNVGGFSLESLSKLSQAKAFDKKTTFLHYIILIVERNNELLLKYYDDIPTVLSSTNIFWDQCQQDLEEVENQLENVRRMALHEARANDDSRVTGVSDDDSLGDLELSLEEEVGSLRASQTGLFTLGAIKQVSALREKIERTRAKCMRLKQYFGVNSETTEPQEIFSVFATFTVDFKKAKEQVFSKANKRQREERKKARQKTPKKQKPREQRIKASSHQPNMNKLFGDLQQRQPSNSSTRQDSQNDPQSSRAGLLSSIKERQSPSERSSPSPQAGLMDAIKQRPSPSRSPVDPRAGLLDAIKKRQPASENSPPVNSRAGLLSVIKQRNPDSETENKSSFVTDRPKPMGGTRSPREAMRHHRQRVGAASYT